MPLSANRNVQRKQSPLIHKVKVVDGAIHIYKGALLSYEAGNIGYAQLSSDPAAIALHEFAGIALEELNVSAADNTADGTYTVEVLSRGCGEIVKLPVTSSITIANVGDAVYADTDEKVDISTGILNTTGGFVGIIREFVSTNVAWVQLTQHPIL